MTGPIRTRIVGHVLEVTLDRPKANAVDLKTSRIMGEVFRDFRDNPELRVAILTGSGERAFCAGADLKEMAAQGLSVLPPGFFPVLGDNVGMSKPVIAAVNGDAFAGGWMLAQMCDLCVASRSARFGITEGRVGRGFPWAAPLIHMIPQRIMAELLMTARPISAQRAYEVGFVNRLAEPDQLLATARQLAEARPSPEAASWTSTRQRFHDARAAFEEATSGNGRTACWACARSTSACSWRRRVISRPTA